MITKIEYRTITQDNTEVWKEGLLLSFVALTPNRRDSKIKVWGNNNYYYETDYFLDPIYQETVVAMVACEDGSIIQTPYYNCKVVREED